MFILTKSPNSFFYALHQIRLWCSHQQYHSNFLSSKPSFSTTRDFVFRIQRRSGRSRPGIVSGSTYYQLPSQFYQYHAAGTFLPGSLTSQNVKPFSFLRWSIASDLSSSPSRLLRPEERKWREITRDSLITVIIVTFSLPAGPEPFSRDQLKNCYLDVALISARSSHGAQSRFNPSFTSSFESSSRILLSCFVAFSIMAGLYRKSKRSSRA